MNRLPLHFLLLLSACLIPTTALAQRPFFPFDNGLTDVKSPQEQAALLKRLGYDGICTRPRAATAELVGAFDQQGLRILTSYVVLKAGATLPESLEAHFQLIKKHQPVIWLGIQKSKSGTDQDAAATIRQVVDLAAKHGLPTSLYPHVGFHTDTVKSCERLHPLVERPDLGISFTLCHFLAQNPADELEATIRRISPKLKLVQINGANQLEAPKADWPQLIQPLGQGSFKIARVFKILDEIGYQGPVNLQCYQIKQPAAQHLAASMATWNTLQPRAKQP